MSENIATQVLDDLHGRFLTFYIEDTIYGLELLHVIEIISIQNITKVPNLPSHIKGIINLRGKIVPVIDVRLKLGQPERAYDDKTCIIVAVINEMNVGLIVDSVSEVASIDREKLAAPPEAGGSYQGRHLKSVAQLGDRIILGLDCERFLHTDIYGY